MPKHQVERKILLQAAEMAAKTGFAFVATADGNGWPHLAAAGGLAVDPEGHIILEEWFCPGTIANLRANSRLAVVVWDSGPDTGFQITGELENIKETSILGCDTGKSGVPQIQRQLIVHVDRVLDFRRAPHTDTEE